jgi:hypothetical protein
MFNITKARYLRLPSAEKLSEILETFDNENLYSFFEGFLEGFKSRIDNYGKRSNEYAFGLKLYKTMTKTIENLNKSYISASKEDYINRRELGKLVSFKTYNFLSEFFDNLSPIISNYFSEVSFEFEEYAMLFGKI